MRTLLFGLLSLSFLCANSRAQTSIPTTLDPATLAAEAIAAFSTAPITGVQLSGTAHAIAGSTDETGTFTFTLQSTGESTLTLNLNTLTHTETTGSLASGPQCTWSGADGVQHQIADHNCRTALNWVLPVISLRAQSAALQKSAASGTASDGSEISVLTLSAGTTAFDASTNALLTKLSTAKLALNPKTFWPESLEFKVHPDKDANIDIPILVRYSDYRQVSGATVPFRIEKFLNNGLALDLTVTNAVVQ